MDTYVAVDKNGDEWIYDSKPKRYFDKEFSLPAGANVPLPNGTIEKLIGRTLCWEDEPVPLDNKNYYDKS